MFLRFRWTVKNDKMDDDTDIVSDINLQKNVSSTWLEYFRSLFFSAPDDLPEIILTLSLISTIGGKYHSLFI